MLMQLPPLHPALVHFPIALVTISFVFELLGKILQRGSFRSVGWWTLLSGLIACAISMLLGYSDMSRASLTDETHGYVDLHLRIGWVLLFGITVIVGWRS